MIGWLRLGPRWDEVPLAAIDLEATGLDPQHDQILSIAMVPIEQGAICWGQRWCEHTRPLVHERTRSTAVTIHGILPGEAAQARPLAEALEHFWSLVRGRVLIVHCAALDVALLRQAAKSLGHPTPTFRYVDTME
ncbi:MAG: 3'-5' exonuclease, partial [Myxococcales bacterium]|nr:3'-5' exonuclease [Myxococcales bacterium]